MSVTKLHHSEQFRENTGRHIWAIYIITLFGSCLIAPFFLAQYGYSQEKVLPATILMGLCLYPSARYFANQEVGLPAFPVLCLAYAFLFVIPIFTREPSIGLAYGNTAYLDDEFVVLALLLSILGVGALLVGYYGFQGTALLKRIPAIGLHLDEKKAVVYCGVMGFIAPWLAIAEDFLPGAVFQQISALIRVLQNQGLVAIAILVWLIYARKGGVWYRLLLYCIIGLTIMQGLSQGFIEQAIAPIATVFIMRWQSSKRVSLTSIIAIVAIILFLSPVKQEYRQAVWFDEAMAAESPMDKAWLWTHRAYQYWAETWRGQQSFAKSTEQAASRTDLIHQFAYIRSLTPSDIPYQYGATYSYFLVTLIPRVIWPEKPEAGEANRFFGVNYGFTTEEGAQRSTFGVSLLAESYINFGWVGVIFIMVFQGILLSLLQHMFGEQHSGVGSQAVYVAFFVFFLNGVGTSAEILFGNLFQCLLLGCALLWFIREKPSTVRMGGVLQPLPPRGDFYVK